MNLDRGRSLYESRQYDDAAVEFRRALKTCDQSPAALSGLGKAQLLGGKFADAIVTFDNLLSRQRANTEVMKLKADAQYFLGQDREAEETLLYAVGLDPRSVEFFDRLDRPARLAIALRPFESLFRDLVLAKPCRQ